MKIKYWLLIILWPTMYVEAQIPSSTPLAIGSKLPDNLINEIINYKTAFVNLSDFKNKLIILDFWATWCPPCVAGMPGLSALQKKFKDNIQILPVNIGGFGDTRERITKFLNQRKEIELPSIYDSSLQLYKLFPHRLEPHSIVIDGNGIVRAITDGGYITGENIAAVLEGKKVDMPLKEDVLNWNNEKPLSQLQKATDNLAYHSQFSRHIPGIVGIEQMDLGDDLYKFVIFNANIPDLYLMALERPLYYENSRLILENVSDKSTFLRPPYGDQTVNDAWENANTYTYELIIPKNAKEKLYQFMLEDLNRFMSTTRQIKGRLAKRSVKCLVIVKKKSAATLSTKGGPTYSDVDDDNRTWHNTKFEDIIDALSRYRFLTLPIINATGYNGPLDLQLRTNVTGISDFKEAFNKIGLDLVESTKEIEVLLISQQH